MNVALFNSTIEYEKDGIDSALVRYNKGLLAQNCRFDDIYLQKPAIYSIEREYRFYFICKSLKCNYPVYLKIEGGAGLLSRHF